MGWLVILSETDKRFKKVQKDTTAEQEIYFLCKPCKQDSKNRQKKKKKGLLISGISLPGVPWFLPSARVEAVDSTTSKYFQKE